MRLQLVLIFQMNDSSITVRLQALGHEIDLIELHEQFYRRAKVCPIHVHNAREKQQLRLLEIREELEELRAQC